MIIDAFYRKVLEYRKNESARLRGHVNPNIMLSNPLNIKGDDRLSKNITVDNYSKFLGHMYFDPFNVVYNGNENVPLIMAENLRQTAKKRIVGKEMLNKIIGPLTHNYNVIPDMLFVRAEKASKKKRYTPNDLNMFSGININKLFNQTIYLSSGWAGHAIGLYIESLPENMAIIAMFNSGSGLNYHRVNANGLYEVIVEKIVNIDKVKIFVKVVTITEFYGKLFIRAGLSAMTSKKSSDRETDVYKGWEMMYKFFIGQGKRKISELWELKADDIFYLAYQAIIGPVLSDQHNDLYYHLPQYGGSCTYFSVYHYVRYMVIKMKGNDKKAIGLTKACELDNRQRIKDFYYKLDYICNQDYNIIQLLGFHKEFSVFETYRKSISKSQIMQSQGWNLSVTEKVEQNRANKDRTFAQPFFSSGGIEIDNVVRQVKILASQHNKIITDIYDRHKDVYAQTHGHIIYSLVICNYSSIIELLLEHYQGILSQTVNAMSPKQYMGYLSEILYHVAEIGTCIGERANASIKILSMVSMFLAIVYNETYNREFMQNTKTLEKLLQPENILRVRMSLLYLLNVNEVSFGLISAYKLEFWGKIFDVVCLNIAAYQLERFRDGFDGFVLDISIGSEWAKFKEKKIDAYSSKMAENMLSDKASGLYRAMFQEDYLAYACLVANLLMSRIGVNNIVLPYHIKSVEIGFDSYRLAIKTGNTLSQFDQNNIFKHFGVPRVKATIYSYDRLKDLVHSAVTTNHYRELNECFKNNVFFDMTFFGKRMPDHENQNFNDPDIIVSRIHGMTNQEMRMYALDLNEYIGALEYSQVNTIISRAFVTEKTIKDIDVASFLDVLEKLDPNLIAFILIELYMGDYKNELLNGVDKISNYVARHFRLSQAMLIIKFVECTITRNIPELYFVLKMAGNVTPETDNSETQIIIPQLFLHYISTVEKRSACNDVVEIVNQHSFLHDTCRIVENVLNQSGITDYQLSPAVDPTKYEATCVIDGSRYNILGFILDEKLKHYCFMYQNDSERDSDKIGIFSVNDFRKCWYNKREKSLCTLVNDEEYYYVPQDFENIYYLQAIKRRCKYLPNLDTSFIFDKTHLWVSKTTESVVWDIDNLKQLNKIGEPIGPRLSFKFSPDGVYVGDYKLIDDLVEPYLGKWVFELSNCFLVSRSGKYKILVIHTKTDARSAVKLHRLDRPWISDADFLEKQDNVCDMILRSYSGSYFFIEINENANMLHFDEPFHLEIYMTLCIMHSKNSCISAIIDQYCQIPKQHIHVDYCTPYSLYYYAKVSDSESKLFKQRRIMFPARYKNPFGEREIHFGMRIPAELDIELIKNMSGVLARILKPKPENYDIPQGLSDSNVDSILEFLKKYKKCQIINAKIDQETMSIIQNTLHGKNGLWDKYSDIKGKIFQIMEQQTLYPHILAIYKERHLFYQELILRKLIAFHNYLLLTCTTGCECNEILKIYSSINPEIIYTGTRNISITILEICFGNFIKNNQHQIYQGIMDEYHNSNVYQVRRMLMGQGKTSVVTPLIVLDMLYQNPNIKQTFVVLPTHLISQTHDQLFIKQYSSLFLGARIEKYQNIEPISIDGPGSRIIITDDSSVKMTLLSHIDEKHVFDGWKNNGFFIYDEFDYLYNPNTSNLNVPQVRLMLSNYKELIEIIVKLTINTWKKLDQIENGVNTMLARYPTLGYVKYNLIKSLRDSNEMVYRLDYGFGLRDNEKYIAIPYSAVDVPITSSRFSDILMFIELTVLCYLNSGLNTQHYEMMLRFLEAKMDLMESHVFDKLYRQIFDSVNNFYRSGSKNSDDIQTIEWYINNIIVPEHVTCSDINANANFLDISRKDFSLYKAGFSGTTNIELTEKSKYEFGSVSTHTEDTGEILCALTGITNVPPKFFSVDVSQKATSSELDNAMNTIIQIVKQEKYNCVIDAGAILRNVAPKDFVEKIVLDTDYDVYLYVDKNDKILMRPRNDTTFYDVDRTIRFQDVNYFFYYDNKHIVGTDFPQPYNFSGLCTISDHNDLTQISQAIYRMRNLNYGHHVSYVVSKRMNINDPVELVNFLERQEIGKVESTKNSLAMQDVLHELKQRDPLNYKIKVYNPLSSQTYHDYVENVYCSQITEKSALVCANIIEPEIGARKEIVVVKNTVRNIQKKHETEKKFSIKAIPNEFSMTVSCQEYWDMLNNSTGRELVSKDHSEILHALEKIGIIFSPFMDYQYLNCFTNRLGLNCLDLEWILSHFKANRQLSEKFLNIIQFCYMQEKSRIMVITHEEYKALMNNNVFGNEKLHCMKIENDGDDIKILIIKFVLMRKMKYSDILRMIKLAASGPIEGSIMIKLIDGVSLYAKLFNKAVGFDAIENGINLPIVDEFVQHGEKIIDHIRNLYSQEKYLTLLKFLDFPDMGIDNQQIVKYAYRDFL